MAKGALKNPPSKTAQPAAPNPADIQARISFLQKTRPNDPSIAGLKTKLAGLQSTQPTDPNAPQQQAPATFASNTDAANQGMAQAYGQIQQQGQFNPGNFQDTQTAAQKAAFDSFESENEPIFQQQQKQLDDQAAARGVPRDSEEYKTMEQNLQANQQQGRQQAEDQSYQAGLGAQNQAFGQAYQTYQTPYQDLSAYNPAYLQEGQQSLQSGAEAWQGTQNAAQLAAQQRIAQIQGAAQTGAASITGAATTGAASIYGNAATTQTGMNINAQYGLQANNFGQQLTLAQLGLTGNQNTAGNAALQGLGAGIGAGIGSSLTK